MYRKSLPENWQESADCEHERVDFRTSIENLKRVEIGTADYNFKRG
jgi:hypothetical protein